MIYLKHIKNKERKSSWFSMYIQFHFKYGQKCYICVKGKNQVG